jgi:transcriptional regulator with XRE-family HTH domain
MGRAKVDQRSTVWLRDRLGEAREPGAWQDELGPLSARVPIVGERLRACREALHLTMAELAQRASAGAWSLSAQMIGKVEAKGQRTAYGRALALAVALTGPEGDPQYLLRWLVRPALVGSGADGDPVRPCSLSEPGARPNVLAGTADMSPREQFLLWRQRNVERRARAEVMAAQVREKGEAVRVRLQGGPGEYLDVAAVPLQNLHRKGPR